MHDSLTEAHDRQVAAQTLREQERLGRELHDTLGPQMTAISMLATSLHDRLQARSSDETALAAKLLDRIEQAKQDVRTLAKGLIPVDIDGEGLMSALAELADDITATSGVRCDFECDGPVTLHDNFNAIRLFRVAKEAVHNAVKHAQAERVLIRLRDEGRVVLEIHDDGLGFSPADQGEGNGLRMMRYRCQLIGGKFDIQASPGGGTSVTCEIDQLDDRHV